MSDRNNNHKRKRHRSLTTRSGINKKLEVSCEAVSSTINQTTNDVNNNTPTTFHCDNRNNNDEDDDVDDNVVPIRNCHNLFVCHTTIHCALYLNCIPCAYKVGLFDVALDTKFCSIVPNQRPEMCPRLLMLRQPQQQQKSTFMINDDENSDTLGYNDSNGMKILTIGDGDFTFSLSIARKLFVSKNNKITNRSSSPPTKMNSTTQLIATSYEKIDTLRTFYPMIDHTIQELESFGVIICYEVDATHLVESLFVWQKKQQHSKRTTTAASTSTKMIPDHFDRIIWNFPCHIVENGKDGQNDQMELNKILIQSFISNAYQLLVMDEKRHHYGQIHLTHKTKV
jgi:Domain of unknown function (DUF2431)